MPPAKKSRQNPGLPTYQAPPMAISGISQGGRYFKAVLLSTLCPIRA